MIILLLHPRSKPFNMKDEKLLKYLFSSKKHANQTIDDRQKYDARLLAFLSSDKVIEFFNNEFISTNKMGFVFSLLA